MRGPLPPLLCSDPESAGKAAARSCVDNEGIAGSALPELTVVLKERVCSLFMQYFNCEKCPSCIIHNLKIKKSSKVRQHWGGLWKRAELEQANVG